MTSVARAFVVVLCPLAVALGRPAAAAAQESLDICSNQPIPRGYLITATQNRPSCPGFQSTGYNSLTIRLPTGSANEALDVCSNQTIPRGYLVTATQNRPSCPGFQSTGYNSVTIRLPSGSENEALDICSNQTIPRGYVVTATQNRPSCPGFQSTGYNGVTIRLPGESGSICSELSVLGREYVVTSRTSRPSCPGFNGTSANSATYRRLADAGPPQGPVPHGALTPLDRHDRGVYRRLREMEEWLGVGAPTHRPWIAAAAGGSTARAGVQVEAGGRYTLTAVCDDDCGDVDLRVLDGAYVVAQDARGDADAHLEISPARSGTLTIEATVRDCARNLCHFGVGAYESGSSAVAPRSRRPPRRPRN